METQTNKNLKKDIHKDKNFTLKKSHIICPLCTENVLACGTYDKLKSHLEVQHEIQLQIEKYSFDSVACYEQWFGEQNIESNYCASYMRKRNDFMEKLYSCNRSNLKGYNSKYSKRAEKAGGSIKMYGVCPSRMIIKIWHTGQASVTFWKSHVGHEEEIRSQHLTKLQKTEIVEKLYSGVTVERIISDARKITSEKLQRINMLNRKDISYLMRKRNVMKRKHENSMIAVTLKVQEWNEGGKNYCFFFKQQGENHPKLRVEDFCLGFMNDTMEYKLKNFHRIICMDGTHCTNREGMDLTIMLVKDDRNMGFPVAFL